MYNKGRNRIVAGVMDMTRSIFTKYINPTNLLRLQKTLDLSDVNGHKPCINAVMVPISERLDEEEREAALKRALEWQNRGWPSSMLYDCMGEDYYEDEDGSIILNPKNLKKLNKRLYGDKKKSTKRGSRGKGKKTDYVTYQDEDEYWENRQSLYTHGEWSDDEDNYEEGYKKIKFYPDITNEMSVIEFDSLKKFNDFCDERGYLVGTTDYENLKNWGTVHCCLDPIDLEYGEFAIITDTSYGGLYWTVEKDLPEDVKHPELVKTEN